MKYINITPHSVLSFVLSCSILCNAVLPGFSQTKPTPSKKTNPHHLRIAIEQKADKTFANESIHPPLYLQQQQKFHEAAEKLANGSLSKTQLTRLAEIRSMFLAQKTWKNASKTDFQLFQETYAKKLNEEYSREKKFLQDTKQEMIRKANKSAADFRKEIYEPLVHDVATQVLSQNNEFNQKEITQLTKQITKNITALAIDPKRSLEEQISTLTKKYKNNPQAVTILNQVAQNAQNDKDQKYLIREQAVQAWRQEAQHSIDQWYAGNETSLNTWKKQAQAKTKQVFDKEYAPQMLKEREEAVMKAVKDLWAYKSMSPRARETLLLSTPIIAQLRTLNGKSFFTPQQTQWIVSQYIQILQKSKCATSKQIAGQCNLELTAISGLGMLTSSREAASAIEQFMTKTRTSEYAVPTLLTGTAALLAMKQYSILGGFLYAATRDERDVSNFDILSVETMVNTLANINGQYLGEISKYAQYPLQANATEKTAMGNAWEDVAQLLADNGSPQALELLRKYGVEKCVIYQEKTISLQHKQVMSCTGIVPFLVGALASGKSGANQYKPTSVETTPGYVATNHGNHYISPAQAQANARSLANRTQAFYYYASSKGLNNTAAIARHLFLQSMGDLNAESELRVDTKLYQVFKTATKGKTPKAGFGITAYTRNSPAYNAKRARQDRTQFFRKVARWADIGILVWCVVDFTKWSMNGIKIARAITKATSMARKGATVAQRAVMLRNLNIAPKLRSFVSVPGKIKNGMAPAVLAELPHFTSQTVELPKFAGFVESAGTLAANSLRFSAETGALSVDVASLTEQAAGTLTPEKIASFNTLVGDVATQVNTQFANRSAWQRLWTWNKGASYRTQLANTLTELGGQRGFALKDLNTMRFMISEGNITVPQNIATFKVPSLLRNIQGTPTVNVESLTTVMATALKTKPTAEQLAHTQGLLEAAVADSNLQFLNRNWLTRQWNFLRGNHNTKYKNLLLDNLAAQFDKDGAIFTDATQYSVYNTLKQMISADRELHAPAWTQQFHHLGTASHDGKFHQMGSTLFQGAENQETPYSLPLLFQMQRKRWMRGGIAGVDANAYQRVVITQQKDGSFMFGFGNNLSEPLKPSQFKLTLEADDVPTLLRASQGYTGAPLQLKLTSTSGTNMFTPGFYSKRWTAFKQARQDGKFLPLGTFLRGKNNIYVHEVPAQLRLADGSLQRLPITFKADSYLGLRDASIVLEQNGTLAWYQNGTLLTQLPRMSFGLPKNQIKPFLDITRNLSFNTPLRVSGLSGKNKITPLMWATGLSLSSASTGLIAPLENVYGDNITEGEKTMISLAFPYLPSLAAPVFSPLVMKIGALRTLQIALGVSTAGLAFTAYKGFSGKLDNQNLPPIWPLYVSGTAIGISSALSRSGLNLLIDSMGGGGTLLKSMAYKNIGSFALLLPPFVANFIDKDIDFSLAFPVLGTLSAGALTWVSTSRISSNIGKVKGFMEFKPFEFSRPISWLPTLGKNSWTMLKATGKESWSTARLLATKEVLPLVLAATAFTGFEAGAFSKAGNQMIRPNLQSQDLPSWVPENNRKNYVSMLTNLSVIAFPLLARFTAKPTLKLMETGRAGDEYRRMLQASFALNTVGAGLLYANGFNGYGSLGMLGIGLMGFGTANMTQSFQKLSNISVKSSSYARILTKGLAAAEKKEMEKSLVTKTMTGFPVQQLGIAIVPTIVSAYTDRQINEGTIQKSDAAHSSMWIPIISLALCFGASATHIGLFPKHIPTGTLSFTKGIFGSYSNAVKQMQIPQFYITEPAFGTPAGFNPIPTNPIVNMSEIVPSSKHLEKIETKLEKSGK